MLAKYKKGELMQNELRLDKIESIVTQLESDLRIMASGVTEMASSIKTLIDMQTDQKLLKQELEYRCNIIHSRLDTVDQRVNGTVERLSAVNSSVAVLEKNQNTSVDNKNTLAELYPLLVVVRYPKLLIGAIALLYVVSIKEIRDIVLPFLV